MKRPLQLLFCLSIVCFLALVYKLQPIFLSLNTPETKTAALGSNELESEKQTDSSKESGTLLEFRTWLEDAAHSPAHNWTQAQLNTGIKLAQERGAAMQDLMRANPDAALAAALSYAEYAKLPKELQKWVEEPFSTAGDLQLHTACAEHYHEMDYHLENAAGEKWQVFLPTHERVGISKNGVPIQGIRLNDLAVVRGAVFQVLSEVDTAFAQANWPSGQTNEQLSFTTGEPIQGKGLLTVSGGRIYRFQNEAERLQVEAAFREADQLPGLNVGSQWLLRTISSDGFPFEAFSQEMVSAAYASTTGNKTALFILVDFPDKPGTPVNPLTLEQVIDTDVSNALAAYSYGNTTMDATVYGTTIRMSNDSGDYFGDTNSDNIQDTIYNYSDLYDQAIQAYIDLGNTNPNLSYDTVGIYFTDLGYPWAGRASIGGQKMWLDGTSNNETILHEFGHNYGLRHANYWVFDASNGASTNPVDPTGANEEYGDDFDVMGSGSIYDGHFHMAAKQFLGWIDNSDWDDLSTSADNGTYRIYRFDDNASSGLQALRVSKSATGDHYWLGYRKDYGNLQAFQKGAYMLWERVGGDTFRNQSWLVDTTPDSIDGKEDAPISLGRTYADADSNVYITPIAVGGNAPAEYIDLVVNFGPFPGNAAPSGTLSGPDSTDARQRVLFSADVADPNADTLAYSWDMGDGQIKTNTSIITHSWSTGGSYEIALTVSDMKGGLITLNKTVTVSDPLNTWTDRNSGVSDDLYGIAANDSHLVTAGDNGVILRSADAVSWSNVSPPGFILNIRFHDVVWTGSEFIAVGQDYDSGFTDWEGVIYTSPTGQTWTRAYETNSADTELYGITYDGASTLIAVGNSATILRKSGAGAWTPISSSITSTDGLLDVAFGDGNFVLVGRANALSSGDVVVSHSSDGLTWTDASSNTGLDSWHDFQEIEFVESAFYASGFYGKLRRSDDNGQTWSNPSGDRYQIDGFASIAGVRYAVGRNLDDSGADIDLVSNEGLTWTEIAPGTLPDRNELVSFMQTFISVGDTGSIRQSGIITGSTGYDTYAATYFPGGGSDVATDANPDFDWANNLLEYALGGNPDSNNDAPTKPVMYFDASDYAVFEITRDAKQQDVAYSAWWSQDLEAWTQAGLTVLEDTPTLLKVRTDQTFDQQSKAFFKLQLDR